LCLNFLTLLFNYSSGSSSSLFLPCTIISLCARWARFFILERLRHRSYASGPYLSNIYLAHVPLRGQSHYSLTAFPHSHTHTASWVSNPSRRWYSNLPPFGQRGLAFPQCLYCTQYSTVSRVPNSLKVRRRLELPVQRSLISIQPAGLKRSRTAADSNRSGPEPKDPLRPINKFL